MVTHISNAVLLIQKLLFSQFYDTVNCIREGGGAGPQKQGQAHLLHISAYISERLLLFALLVKFSL